MLLPPEYVYKFFPEFRSTQTPWQGLTPITSWLVDDLQPARIVELGSYRGDSFFSFLQASFNQKSVIELVAIDGWEGDQHTGKYGDSVYQQFQSELTSRDDPRARSIKSRFSNAVSKFENSSIDLLHIDGAHDYESVKEDYEIWLPKMTTDGVIIFHDTMVKKDGFGVWKLWAEIEKAHKGRTFNFEHSHGLGILCLGTEERGDIRALGNLGAVEANILRDTMGLIGRRINDLTQYELNLITRNGGKVSSGHLFVRGKEREKLEALMKYELDQICSNLSSVCNTIFDYRIDKLFKDQSADFYAAIKPMVLEELTSLKGSLDARQDEKSSAILEDCREAVNYRIDTLFKDQSVDFYAAIKPMVLEELTSLKGSLDARQDEKSEAMMSKIRDLRNGDLNFAGTKNEAQDDAIIWLGEKVEAHDAVIQELIRHNGFVDR